MPFEIICVHADSTNNASAIGWLFRWSRISPDSLCYDALQLSARKSATLITSSEHCLASQHIKGETNLVADLLSWSGDARGTPDPLTMDQPSDEELTLCFHSHLPQLIPESFQIFPLPSKILSWITLALQTVESSWIRTMNQGTKLATESGGAGGPAAATRAYLTTASLLNYPKRQSTSSFAPSSDSVKQLNPMRNPSPTNPSHTPQRHWFDCHQHHHLQEETWPHHQHLHPQNPVHNMLVFWRKSNLRV
jgi:hypothetical protein